MSRNRRLHSLLAPRQVTTWLGVVLLTLTICPNLALAQIVLQQIGGVKIDAYGVITKAPLELRKTASELLREKLEAVPEQFAAQTDLRFVSLKSIETALAESVSTGQPVADDVRFLNGLQRIDYVFAYPEKQDIVLVGPGEAWIASQFGDVIGATSGKPVLLLDDLLVALRTSDAARTVGISCSIDPTPEGRQSLQRYLGKQKRFHAGVAKGVEQALGQQQISVTGVPADSHFAGVLVAADFQMKRYAMGLEPAPVEGMASFLDLIKEKRGKVSNMMPRWWMACDYESMAKTSDGLGWQLRGRGVKVMTEDDIVNANGTTTGSGNSNPIAQQWASNMTERFEELAKVESVFGQVRNLMEVSIVAALITQHDMQGLTGCKLDTMTGANLGYDIEKWPAPKTVASQASFVKVRKEYVITASGGVLLDPWSVISKVEENDEVAKVYNQGN